MTLGFWLLKIPATTLGETAGDYLSMTLNQGTMTPHALIRSKTAHVTLGFWLLKIPATTLGETAGDYLSMTLDLGYYVGLAITFALLAAALAVQITRNRFHTALFWLTMIAATTAGTEISDFIDRSLGLGYEGGTAVLLTGLLVTLGAWKAKVGSLQPWPILRKDAELLFWTAVLFSNSLGTAFGDYLTDNAELSYLQGAGVTAAVIAVTAVLHYRKAANETALFWAAFIFSRPFGATFGDFLTKLPAQGGLDLPRESAALACVGVMALILAYEEHRTRNV